MRAEGDRETTVPFDAGVQHTCHRNMNMEGFVPARVLCVFRALLSVSTIKGALPTWERRKQSDAPHLWVMVNTVHFDITGENTSGIGKINR